MSKEWHEIKTAPAEEIVETKIDDADGVRNVQPLRRTGRLWWMPDGSMYVYYTPTHWRPLSVEILEALARDEDERARRATKRAADLRHRAAVTP